MEPRTPDFVIRPIRATDAALLGDFFAAVAADAEAVRFFHPHPLTPEYAAWVCGGATQRRDRYYLALYQGRAVAYAMLRGWDEGYATPSWGGCVHPALRGAGLGHALLAHAVAEGRAAGATQLRLTVYKANARAVHLYRKFGFVFRDGDGRSVVGSLDLTRPVALPPANPDSARLWAWLEAGAARPAA
jgi:ribosomal protein S18 acetylase RimI-like enzyme